MEQIIWVRMFNQIIKMISRDLQIHKFNPFDKHKQLASPKRSAKQQTSETTGTRGSAGSSNRFITVKENDLNTMNHIHISNCTI